MTARERLGEAISFVLNSQYTVTIALATFGDDDEHPTYRSLNISPGVAEGFTGLARQRISKLDRQHARGYTSVREYDDGYIPQTHDIDYIDLDDDLLGGVASVPSPSHIPLIGDIDAFVDHVRFYILILSRAGRRVVLFRKYNRNKELVRSRNLVVRLFGDRLESIQEPVFQFDPNIDVILYRNELFILNRESFQHVFRFYDVLRQTAQASLQTISQAVPIANFAEFEESCLGHLHKLKKLRSIARKPYLADIAVDDLRRIVQRFQLNVEFNDHNQLVFDISDRWAILHLLDDAYLDSDMTGLQYETNSKREI